MNRIILLVLFVFSYCVGSSQAITQRGTTAVTVQDARLFAQYNFRPPVFNDTVQANLQIGLDSCGALIFSRSINSYYLRACSPKRWVAVSSGGGSGNSWDIGGNASPSSPNIGTTTATEFNTITNGIARTKIKGSGIARSSAARNKYLMIDTTDKYLYYGDAISTTPTLQQVTDVGYITTNPLIVGNLSSIYAGFDEDNFALQNGSSFTSYQLGSITSNNGTLSFPNTGIDTRYIPVRVNGYFANSSGEITIPTISAVDTIFRTLGKDSIFYKKNNITYSIKDSVGGSGTVTSVGLTMPSAFTVSNSPVTGSGTIGVTGSGTVSQYVRGDGTLANFPNSTGGGASVNYYLNGSVSQGTFGGDTYYEMSKTPILGAGTNFTRTNGAGNGYIASFITDAGDPNQLNIPGGNWNLEFYFNSSASGGTPSFYAELYKVDVTNAFTLIASGSANPESITNGTTVDQYFTSLPVPQTTLLITDRLAIRIYVITGGRTLTLHTENGNLCEILTTFTTGLTALNGLTEQVQNFATGTSGTDFGISSSSATHTFNLPTASATNRGALSTSDWSTFNGKLGASDTISLSNRIENIPTNLELLQLMSFGIKAEPYGVTLANMSSQLSLVTNRLFIYPFNWNVSDTLRGVSFFNRAAFTNTASNYNGIAIYSLSGGTLNRIVFTANDGTFWNTTINSWKSASFTPTFLTKGIYFIAYEFSGTGTPTLGSGAPLVIASTQSPSEPPSNNNINNNGIKFSTFILNSTATPPSSIAMSTTTAVVNVPYFLFF